ncbi:hypothetical protein PPACK8108_LOCUS3489 [Phakopsora pachyrhizi]|uniref:RRM domain-containing protein n=1 Tax=Phakopsora pachyrhizi TaxID=170000 RepID=A0AAV0AK76_PHAPC|nr:hypothetical protein PPACK8108_LOCUS3489 [Phakopsora pachyrhizi]
MAAMLGQMQQQQQQTVQSAGYNQLQAAMNSVRISSLLAGVNGYGQQTNFPSPNSAVYANFPSPGLSQTSYGTMPSAQNGTFSPGLVSGISQLGAINGQTGQTVYVGNLPADVAVDELLSQVCFGPIDIVKVLPEKNCAFISFLDPTTAAAFHSDALMRKIQLHGQELKIGRGKPSAVPTNVVMAVQQNGATRNLLRWYKRLLLSQLGPAKESIMAKQRYNDACASVESSRVKQGQAKDEKHLEKASKTMDHKMNEMLSAKIRI